MSALRLSPTSSTAVGAPTVPSPELRSMLQAFAALGYDRHRLLAAAGLDLADLDDPDLRLPCTVYDALLTQAQRERVTPNIALRLAMHTPIGAFPLLDYLIVTSDTVRAGLHQLRRYFQLTGSPVVIEISDDLGPVRFMSSDRQPLQHRVPVHAGHSQSPPGDRGKVRGVADQLFAPARR